MQLGNDLVGIFIGNINDNKLNVFVINIRLFPISIFFEREHDLKSYELRLKFFNKLNIGMYLNSN